MRHATPEGKLKREVERLIQMSPAVLWYCRMNTGTASIGGRRVPFGYPGMADFYVRVRRQDGGAARTVWLELKATTKQSDAQITFQHEMEMLGDRYRVVRTIEDAADAIRIVLK